MTTISNTPAAAGHAGGDVREIDPRDVRRSLEAGTAILVDVREASENRAERIEGAVLVPLSKFDPASVPAAPGKTVVLHCAGGRRSMTVARRLTQAGRADIASMAGGLRAWREAGLGTIVEKGAPIDVMRQTQIAIGVFVLTGLALGVWVWPGFLALSALMGAGLIFAGSTGWCGMAMLMARMPWNSAHQASRP